MGDSAGGNLSAVVTLLARDRGGPRIAFQGLLYPATDLTLSSPSVAENADAPILTRADCFAYRDHYLAGQDPRHPYASPLFAADHSGLPPALVQVAEHDPIRDDGLRYAAALREAGVRCGPRSTSACRTATSASRDCVAALRRRSRGCAPSSRERSGLRSRGRPSHPTGRMGAE
jgi:acetyl esterase/lipase